MFTPKHPKTKPNLAEIRKEEEKLDIEGLVKRASENITKIRIGEL